jgi:hypothetical protein
LLIPPVVLEGDSLAWQMRPVLERHLPIAVADVESARPTAVGVARLVALRHRVSGRPILVSLGTVDALQAAAGVEGAADAKAMAHQARRVLRLSECVVWGLVRIDYGDGGAAVNRGLRRVKRLHLVRAVKPSRDGAHPTRAGTRRLARRFARTARREC